MKTHLPIVPFLAAALLALGGCSFDDSALDDRPACSTDDECEDGLCIAGSCTPFELITDGDATADAGDGGATDAGDDPDGSVPDGGTDGGVDAGRDTSTDGGGPVCTPSEAICDGEIAIVCDAFGQSFTETDCSVDGSCGDAEFGCRCDEGRCVARACQPGEQRCDGDDVLTCADDGSGFELTETCADGALCIGGTCTEPTCTPGPTECVGDAVVRCSSSGVYVIDAECADLNAECREDADGAYCEPLACNVGTRRCNREGTAVERCADGFEYVIDEACGADAYCEAGACIALACEPGVSRCAGPALRGVCSSDGREERLEPCGDFTYCDEADGASQCVRQVCVPLSSRCIEGSEAFETCDTRGAGYLDPFPCGGDEYCAEGACESQVCEPSTRFCDGDAAYDCDDRGATTTLFATCPFGCADGACLDSICGDGIVDPARGETCDDGNDNACDGCDACQLRQVRTIGAGTATSSATSWVPEGSAFTLELWAEVSGDGALLGLGEATGTDDARLDVTEGRARFVYRMGDGGEVSVVDTVVLPPGWHHIAGVRFDAQGAALFVDGQLRAATRRAIDLSGVDGTGRLWIGSDGSRPPATATIDTVRVSNVARYAATFSPAVDLPVDANTLAAWDFDADTDNTVRDRSGNGRDLTVASAPVAAAACQGEDPASLVCGDGLRANWEGCDDGNGDDGDGCSSRCEVETDCPGERGANGACYLFQGSGAQWRDARNACRDWGGDLVVIDNDTENAWLVFLRGLDGEHWIGLNDRDREGQYEWSSGSAAGYRNWASGEPNNSFFVEDCTELYGRSGDQRGRWNDENCSDDNPYVCER